MRNKLSNVVYALQRENLQPHPRAHTKAWGNGARDTRTEEERFIRLPQALGDAY